MSVLRNTLVGAMLGVAAATLVTGCAASGSHPNDVPGTAMLRSEGTGRIVDTAPDNGTVYVYDNSEDRMIYSGTVMSGQRVTVNPKDDRIDVDDRKVSDQTLPNGDSYRIYFDRNNPAVVEHRVYEEKRVETHD
jgi:hypothetical protein